MYVFWWVAALLIVALGLIALRAYVIGGAPRSLLSEQEFTERFIKFATAAELSVEISAPAPLQLAVRVRGPEGGVGRPGLGNAYLQYKIAPEQLDAILAAQLDLLRKAILQQQPDADLKRILPIIRGADFVTAAIRQLADIRQDLKAPTMGGVVNSKIADGLYVYYVFDQPTSVSYVTEQEVDRLGLTETDLRRISLENLREQFEEKIKFKSEGSLYLLSLDGMYELSMILLMDDLESRLGGKLKGETVVYILARNALFITGSDEPAALAQAEELAATATSMPYFISKEPYTLREGKWARFHE